MGNLNCRSGARISEEAESEANIEGAMHQMRRTNSIYHGVTDRVLAFKEELLNSAKASFPTANLKNYDSYYAFLSTQINSSRKELNQSTMSETEDSLKLMKPKPHQKENILQQIKRLSRVKENLHSKTRQSATRKTPFTNCFLYEETPNNGLLSTGGKLKPIIPGTTRVHKGRLHETNPVFTRTMGHSSIQQSKMTKCYSNASIAVSVKKGNHVMSFDIISLLPSRIQIIILEFLLDQYRNCIMVSAIWHSTLSNSLDLYFSQAETKIQSKLESYFVFQGSTTRSMLCNSGCWKGIRVDRVLKLELLKGFEGKTIQISYTYCFANDKSSRYRTQYKVDCVKKGGRMQWIHRSQNAETSLTYSMNINQICTGDILEIAINYYTPRGLIDVESINWDFIRVEPSPTEKQLMSRFSTLGTSRNEEGKVVRTRGQIDLNRICELEMTEMEWYDQEYYEMKESLCDLPTIEQYFRIESIEFAELDIKAMKLHLVAAKTGPVPRSLFGIAVVILDKYHPCCVEAKRLGLMIDRNDEIELRSGDSLLFYISRHHQE